MVTSRPTPIPHPYHTRTRNYREQPELTGGRNACYGWVSAGFPWSADSPKMGDVELITRRSRVQIPPPLLKALVNATLARALLFWMVLSQHSSVFFHRHYQGFRPTYDLRVSRDGLLGGGTASPACREGHACRWPWCRPGLEVPSLSVTTLIGICSLRTGVAPGFVQQPAR